RRTIRKFRIMQKISRFAPFLSVYSQSYPNHIYIYICMYVCMYMYIFVFKSWTSIVSRTFTLKGGLSRKEIIQLKVNLLKVFVKTLSALLSVEGHRVVVLLRAVQMIIAPLTRLLLMEMMVIGLLNMLTR